MKYGRLLFQEKTKGLWGFLRVFLVVCSLVCLFIFSKELYCSE